jgi:hypothetical protein
LGSVEWLFFFTLPFFCCGGGGGGGGGGGVKLISCLIKNNVKLVGSVVGVIYFISWWII